MSHPTRVLSRSTLGIVAAGVLLAAAPYLISSDYILFLLTQAAILYLVALGLNVLTGYGGITSIGHGALVAVGAYTMGIATVNYGWPFWGGLVLAMVTSGLCGLALALPAVRLSTWYFALITLGFGSVVSGLIMELGWLTNGFNGIIGTPMPEFFGLQVTSRSLFWFVAAAAFAAFLITRNLIGSRMGRALLAIKESPLTATSVGVRVNALKLGAFTYSAVLAGLAGSFFATNQGVITPDDFTVDFSIFFLLVVVLGGLGAMHGPLLGTAAFFLLPYLMTGLQEWRLLIYAIGLLILMIFFPQGLAGLIALASRRIGLRQHGVVQPSVVSRATSANQGASLAIEVVGKNFGGVRALQGVSITVEAGTIHGIIGPNGSGKTTLVNLISGYYNPDTGSIRIDGRETKMLSASRLARAGVRRTFQTPKLIPDLTVIENVMFGAYADERSSLAAIALALPGARREAKQRLEQAMGCLEFVGLSSHANTPVGEIAHGQQRLAEIARALVGRPRLLLLDEPAAGLSMGELDSLRDVIAAIAASGTTVVIVEHHLELIAELCSLVTVMDRGQLLKEGTPAAVFADADVLATYMGRRALVTGAAG